jgi:hypothetical protein
MKINVILSGLDPGQCCRNTAANFAQRYVVESVHTPGTLRRESVK